MQASKIREIGRKENLHKGEQLEVSIFLVSDIPLRLPLPSFPLLSLSLSLSLSVSKRPSGWPGRSSRLRSRARSMAPVSKTEREREMLFTEREEWVLSSEEFSVFSFFGDKFLGFSLYSTKATSGSRLKQLWQMS